MKNLKLLLIAIMMIATTSISAQEISTTKRLKSTMGVSLERKDVKTPDSTYTVFYMMTFKASTNQFDGALVLILGKDKEETVDRLNYLLKTFDMLEHEDEVHLEFKTENVLSFKYRNYIALSPSGKAGFYRLYKKSITEFLAILEYRE